MIRLDAALPLLVLLLRSSDRAETTEGRDACLLSMRRSDGTATVGASCPFADPDHSGQRAYGVLNPHLV